jgi:hypothetical protein
MSETDKSTVNKKPGNEPQKKIPDDSDPKLMVIMTEGIKETTKEKKK